MNFFTPELLAQLGSADPAAVRAAEAEWERRLQSYEEYLERIEPELPPQVRAFGELLLHDARVYGLARNGSEFLLILHKDVPPRELVIVTYELVGEPVVDREARTDDRSAVMAFDYDELGIVREGGRTLCTQSILFSNGWELRLTFSGVKVVLADPVFLGVRPTIDVWSSFPPG
jgi:hypothetical protein